MANFGAINQFGSLTINGKTLRFEDFDTDKNGEISSQEYQSLLKEVKLDTVELSSVDTNKDESLSTEEFAAWEEKIAMQEAVNNMAGQISKDFTGKTQYLTEVREALKESIEEFATNYTGEASKMAEVFEAQLPDIYVEIKDRVLANDPATVTSKIVDDTFAKLKEEGLNDTTARRISLELEKEANTFIKSYKGANLEADLRAHLQNFLNTSDAKIMANAAAEFKNGTQDLGPVYDSNDLAVIKAYAKDLLTNAVNNGVTIKLGGINIKTSTAITTALNKYTDGEELLNAINDAINSLNKLTKKEQFIAEEKEKAEERIDKAFKKIKGEEYQINSGLIDFSKVDKRYFQEGGEIYQRGDGWGGSRELAYNEGFNLLTSDGLKAQIKAQIEDLLKSKGIPFDMIEEVFENIYNQTAQETLNAEGMITGRGARGCSSKGKAHINVKTLCDTFITNFNTNIAKAVNEMNASNTDMDLVDLDFGAMTTNEDGKKVAENGEDFEALYASGKTVTTRKKGADYYAKIANRLINNIKAQMLTKARNMCKANGIEFDNSVFETMFNNAKLTAISAGVTGSGVSHDRVLRIPIIGHHSSSTLNTKTLMDTFTQQFKENYTLWVQGQKAKTKNA